ncbi:hypothetical protein [Microbulbifer sp. SAOS-129_SWC]|uniref:hypothetical protein n=1 Tax=Microbulbifer sp. SAOS-129_SWC TaxID=3145235 RepID=UPI0032176CDE
MEGMPAITPLIVAATASSVALVCLDCRAQSTKKIHRADHLSDLVLLAPFLSLFYTEHFWTSLILTLPVILVSYLTQRICYQMGRLDTSPEVLALTPGSYLISILVYFLLFHHGVLSESQVTVSADTSETFSSHQRGTGFWAYLTYFSVFCVTMTRKSNDGISLSTLALVLAVTILPFFTGHYWYAMLAGLGMLLIALQRAFRVMEAGSSGGLSFMSGYLYLMAAFASMLMYAILF